MWFICSLRPTGSTPCLLPTSPRGDAVGTVFGAEPSNCTDGTFTRVDARFAGAPSVKSQPVRPLHHRGDGRLDQRGAGVWTYSAIK